MVSDHDQKQALRAVLKNQPDIQSHPDLEKASSQFANAETTMEVRLAKFPLQLLQCPTDSPARFLWISPGPRTERLA
jgi:hypothetical protein